MASGGSLIGVRLNLPPGKGIFRYDSSRSIFLAGSNLKRGHGGLPKVGACPFSFGLGGKWEWACIPILWGSRGPVLRYGTLGHLIGSYTFLIQPFFKKVDGGRRKSTAADQYISHLKKGRSSRRKSTLF